MLTATAREPILDLRVYILSGFEIVYGSVPKSFTKRDRKWHSGMEMHRNPLQMKYFW